MTHDSMTHREIGSMFRLVRAYGAEQLRNNRTHRYKLEKGVDENPWLFRVLIGYIDGERPSGDRGAVYIPEGAIGTITDREISQPSFPGSMYARLRIYKVTFADYERGTEFLIHGAGLKSLPALEQLALASENAQRNGGLEQ